MKKNTAIVAYTPFVAWSLKMGRFTALVSNQLVLPIEDDKSLREYLEKYQFHIQEDWTLWYACEGIRELEEILSRNGNLNYRTVVQVGDKDNPTFIENTQGERKYELRIADKNFY